MNLLQICTHEIVTVRPGTTIIAAARLMRDKHVGTVVVMSDMLPPRPVGILTDRDITIRVVAFAGQQTIVAVEQVMSTALVVAPGSMGVHEAIQLMRDRGVRRLLVNGEDGELIGVVSFDDIMMLIADQLAAMAHSIAAGLLREEKNAVQ